MNHTFKGKTALVTGATSGIGRSTAIAFAEAGANVVLFGRRKEEGDAAVEEITQSGSKAIFVQGDHGPIAFRKFIVTPENFVNPLAK